MVTLLASAIGVIISGLSAIGFATAQMNTQKISNLKEDLLAAKMKLHNDEDCNRCDQAIR